MASHVGIINNALARLGAEAILSDSPYDDTKNGRLAERTYSDLRQTLLGEHPWNFAIKRTDLAASATAPGFKYIYAYPVPSDFIDVALDQDATDTTNQFSEWDVEQLSTGIKAIVTDTSAPLSLRYVSDVTDPNIMPATFREALSARLAMEWAEAISMVGNVQERMASLYDRKLRIAKARDAQQSSPKRLNLSSWLDAR